MNSVCIGIDTQKSISRDLLPGWPSEVQRFESFLGGSNNFGERREDEDNSFVFHVHHVCVFVGFGVRMWMCVFCV